MKKESKKDVQMLLDHVNILKDPYQDVNEKSSHPCLLHIVTLFIDDFRTG